MSELPTSYQSFIHLSRYSRWLEDKGRRETWDETVTRYMDFMKWHLNKNCKYNMPTDIYKEVKDHIFTLKVMPAMRCLMTAGEALKRENLCAYNCSGQYADKIRSLDEMLYVLMNGVGGGFSVENQFIQKLPIIAEQFDDTDTIIIVKDSKAGWAKAFRELLSLLTVGQIPKWDLSRIRPKNSRLKTFGGRASGPEPLNRLFKHSVDLFQKAKGRRFNSFEMHFLLCVIANVVRVGGVRRAALSSLSDLNDDRMRNAKLGDWRKEYPDLALANNSVCYTEKPNIGTFMEEWVSLYNSKSGERGLFNRVATKNVIKRINERAGRERRNPNYDFITNPCFEVILRDRELCNLSEVIVRSSDKLKELKDKTRIATIMGTWQASLTNFKYVSSEWAKNCKEEALLGVSMTGIYDNPLTNSSQGEGKLINLLEELRDYSVEVNKEWAKKIGINTAAAITCVKPSGNVSQLVDSSSGIHARHSEYYIRAVSLSVDDPMSLFMISKGFVHESDMSSPDSLVRFLFPIKSPSKSLYREDRTAIEQLELWAIYQKYWCEHKPSITVSVKEHEWLKVGAWVYENFDDVSGVAFFPFSDHDFDQPVYQECTKDEYTKAMKDMPKDIDWAELSKFETDDNTVGSQELACSSEKGCEIT